MKREIGKEWRDADLTHLSVSQLNRTPAYWIYAYLYLRDDRKNITVGENAAVGTAVHNGLQSIVCHGQDITDQILAAQIAFDFHDANQDAAGVSLYLVYDADHDFRHAETAWLGRLCKTRVTRMFCWGQNGIPLFSREVIA